MKKCFRVFLTSIVVALGSSAVLARDVVEVESRYLGGGCFQYTVRALYDPFFTDFGLGQLVPVPFTNYLSNTVPLHWNNLIYQGEWNGILFDYTVSQPRINETTFSIWSSSVNFRRETNGLLTGFHFSEYFKLADCFSEQGFISHADSVPCLVPCAPEEADGSPSNLVARLELIPDLKIDSLIMTNHDVYGLKFSWMTLSTVELQASHDMANWTSVARFFGDPPQSTWTTNSPVSAFGEFFRLRMIAADRHETNALGTATVPTKSSTTRVNPRPSWLNTSSKITVH
jgi:hypothetical protein